MTIAILFFAATAEPAPSPAPAVPPIQVVGEKQKKICHRETPTGSFIPQRVCMTEQQAEARTAYSVQAKQNGEYEEDSHLNVNTQRGR